MPQTVTLQLSCHICFKNGFYGGNLRKHLKSHGFAIKEKRGHGFRRLDNAEYIYTDANNVNAVKHHECLACNFHCCDILDLKAHIIETHTVIDLDKGVEDAFDNGSQLDLEVILPEELAVEDEESSNQVTIEKRDMLTEAYERMSEEQKWKLSTGTCVEDELYKFAMKCEYDHPSLSFIIDPSDSTYKLQGVFTGGELREIKGYNAIVMDTLSKDVVDYLRSFECHSSQELRKACLENLEWYYPFDKEKYFYHDWIRRTIDMLIVEFEAESLKNQHHESWYMVRIWSLIDRIFTDVEGLEAVRGESASIATATRKNQDRVIPSMVKMKRKAMGRRGDLILRKGSAEYGCAEAGAKDEGHWGTKKLLEKGVKAAKTLKDMLNHLSEFVNNEESSVRQLRTIGYILSGLSMELMIMDSPKGYCCRITRSKVFSIPTTALQVKSKLLPLMSILIATKFMVVKVIDLVENHGISETDFTEALKTAFDADVTPPTSPEHNTIRLPTCNITPTKRKLNGMS